LAFDLRARTEHRGSQQIWLDRGGTLPRPWPAPAVTEIVPGTHHIGEGWQLETFEVPHAQPMLTCLGFKISAAGTSFVYSGDAGLCRALETAAQGADLLLHWCYRNEGEVLHPSLDAIAPTPSDIAAMAMRAGVKRLVLTHFRAHMDSEAGHDTARDALRDAFDGPAEIAEDLRIYEI